MDVKVIIKIFLCLIMIGCSNKRLMQINITVKVVDSETNLPRIHDTITIRQARWGIPRRYIQVGEYVTDSIGVVALKLNKNNRYSFEVNGSNNTFGSDEYGENELSNNQQIIIRVVSPHKKQFKTE